MTGAGIILVALAIDAVLGWPKALFDLVGHPVTWIGRLISALDQWLNLEGTPDTDRRRAGFMAALVTIGVAALLGGLIQLCLPYGLLGIILGGVFAWPLIAARSLHDHVAAVAHPLAEGDLTRARTEVAKIVGRDPAKLDQAGVARAAIESLAENASDGVIAPLFWGALFGLPGIAAYKAINTLDSMIGHRTPRHEAFGFASAKIDDVANFLPARLTGLLFAAVSAAPRRAFDLMRADAPKHRSPNAGWPEASMAAALGIRLSGPRIYDDRISDEPWVNEGAPDPVAEDIRRGLGLYRLALILSSAVLAILWLM